jgi:hypothetical protein
MELEDDLTNLEGALHFGAVTEVELVAEESHDLSDQELRRVHHLRVLLFEGLYTPKQSE